MIPNKLITYFIVLVNFCFEGLVTKITTAIKIKKSAVRIIAKIVFIVWAIKLKSVKFIRIALIL